MEAIDNAVQAFITKLKRGLVSGSYSSAVETANICRMIVGQPRWKNAKGLIRSLRHYGEMMAAAKPSELVIENVVRRVLFIVREEQKNRQLEQDVQEEKSLEKVDLAKSIQFKLKRSASSVFSNINQPGMVRMLEDSSLIQNDESAHDLADETDFHSVKRAIIEEIEDLVGEFQDLYLNVADQAIEHIHANEVIMTIGRARTVEHFLKEAARKRQFQLVVAEGAPSYNGREMAMNMAKEGIETILIADSAISAMMARVNKVIIGTHAVMANGGLVAQIGTRLIAQSAADHSVPVLVCCGLYKLSPRFPSDEDMFQEYKSPAEIVPFDILAEPGAENLRIINPTWDYVPPELVSLFVTNTGGHNPTYIYRLLAEFYSPLDDDLFQA